MGSGRPVPICGTGRVPPRAQNNTKAKNKKFSFKKTLFDFLFINFNVFILLICLVQIFLNFGIVLTKPRLLEKIFLK